MSASSSVCSLAPLLLAATMLVPSGCKPKPAEIRVERIVLRLPRALDEAPDKRDVVRAEIAERLNQDPLTEYAPKGRDGTHVLRLGSGPVVGVPGESSEMRPVIVQLSPRQKGVREYEATGRGLPLAEVGDSVMTGFDNAWELIGQQRWMDVGDDERLVRGLRHPEASLRDFAIARLGERKSKAGVEPLCELLDSEKEDPLRILRAVGALVAIGDQRAVEPLIELTRRKDPRFVMQVVFALSAIGGRTAEGYLVTLASGHPLEMVRKSAEDALAEMQSPPGEDRPQGESAAP